MIFITTEIGLTDCILWIVILILVQDGCTICFFPVNADLPHSSRSFKDYSITAMTSANSLGTFRCISLGWMDIYGLSYTGAPSLSRLVTTVGFVCLVLLGFWGVGGCVCVSWVFLRKWF